MISITQIVEVLVFKLFYISSPSMITSNRYFFIEKPYYNDYVFVFFHTDSFMLLIKDNCRHGG